MGWRCRSQIWTEARQGLAGLRRLVGGDADLRWFLRAALPWGCLVHSPGTVRFMGIVDKKPP
jgi:hypothetical protein